ncbi:hypothetical protein BU16DRAFT_565668 [Lophium mytilinum]|uniref:Galactose oxidase n=1 Tax=Lophium mytilinum TaxID=390894 RepID=A0A6A6QFD5_9PEZI|nr:hypothetical protein BU16DRAFT_565668 [Lophium mytilinum]
MARALFCLVVALVFAAQSLQDTKDPLNDFCRRFGHQTAVIDRKLYIDGGLVQWSPISANPANFTNTWLLYNDLNTTTDDGGMPQLHANLTKNSSIPSVSGGILWTDEANKVFYLYGGQFQDSPDDFSFWMYDTVLNQWNHTDGVLQGIERVAFGAGTTIDDLGYGFYYGGWMNNQTVPGWNGAPLATSNLIKYDMNTNTWTNNTGPDSMGRAEGVMSYLPASDGGMLVYFGGVTDPYQDGTVVGANMSEIHLFDVASSKWYTQNATGEIPDMRRKFCAGVTWADDHSSYNIYLYGGQGIHNITGFDDAYVLSVPSFKWVKMYGEGSAPHGISSCNVIDYSQMLVIGGYFANTDSCDSPNVWGTHNMNLGENGPANSLWDQYHPNITKYLIPTPIISVIGGGPTGGATATKPASDWSNPDLSVYFTRVPTFAARTATRYFPSGTSAPGNGTSHHNSHVGAIAGGAVGGLVFLIAVLLLALFCLHRHKKNLKNKPAPQAPPPPPVELPVNNPATEMSAVAENPAKWAHSPGAQSAAPSYNHQHSPYGTPPTRPAEYHTPISGYPTQQGSYPSSPHTSYPPQPYPPGTYPPSAYPPGTYPQGYQDQQQQQYDPQLSPNDPHYAAAYAQQQQHHQHRRTLSNPPYDPSRDAMANEHFPPPRSPSLAPPAPVTPTSATTRGGYESVNREDYDSPPSKTNTPAHFYPQPLNVRAVSGEQRPIRGRFVEVQDDEFAGGQRRF